MNREQAVIPRLALLRWGIRLILLAGLLSYLFSFGR